tara:strand:+ start:592 stop:885 length:294 start_codon:yes stop_codon:yes gene_type:complete
MHNYKALKAASKASVQKVKVVDRAADEEAGIAEESHEDLQLVCKNYNVQTGEVQDDSVWDYSLSDVKREIDGCKADVVKIEAHQADLEQLETDLKAL